MNKAILVDALFIEVSRRIKRKGLALRVAFGCAIRAFRKVYANVQTMNLHNGDTIKVEYTLEINR